MTMNRSVKTCQDVFDSRDGMSGNENLCVGSREQGASRRLLPRPDLHHQGNPQALPLQYECTLHILLREEIQPSEFMDAIARTEGYIHKLIFHLRRVCHAEHTDGEGVKP